MAFNLEKARQAGYTDAEIADYLGSQSNFKVDEARKSGYADVEIVNHLNSLDQNKPNKFVEAVKNGVKFVKDAAYDAIDNRTLSEKGLLQSKPVDENATSNKVPGVPFRVDYFDKLKQQDRLAPQTIDAQASKEGATARAADAIIAERPMNEEVNQGVNDAIYGAPQKQIPFDEIMHEKRASYTPENINEFIKLSTASGADSAKAAQQLNELKNKGQDLNDVLISMKQNQGTLSDIGTSLKIGTEQIPGTITGILDTPTALVFNGRPYSDAFAYIGSKIGFEPDKWSKEATKEYSKKYEAAKVEIDDAWKNKDVTKLDLITEYLKNPAYSANQIATSLPSMLAGGIGSRALMIAGKEGQAAGAFERALGERYAAPVAAGLGEGAVQTGQQMSQYQGDDQRKNAIAALGSGLIDAVIGTGAGRIAEKFGLETAETAIAKGFNTKLGTELSLGRKVVGGAISEGILQELPQSAQEQVWQNFAEHKPLWDGVNRSAVEGAIAGFVMGAGANSITRTKQEKLKTLPDANIERLRATALKTMPQDVPLIDAEIQRRANTDTLTRAAEAGQRETDASLLNDVNKATEAIPATDLLESDNVNISNTPSTLATETTELGNNNPERSGGDISQATGSGTVSNGIADNTSALGQGNGSDLSVRTDVGEGKPDITLNDVTAHAAATSHLNELPQPTEAQKEAGNYKKGSIKVSDLDISVENPHDSLRSGTDKDGTTWENQQNGHYGYIVGVEARSPDKEHVDVNVKPNTPEEFNGDVYVINQNHPDTGKFDEPKVYLGYSNEQEAKDAYHSNYASDWKGFDSIVPVSMEQFKSMLNDKKAFLQPVKENYDGLQKQGQETAQEIKKRSVIRTLPTTNPLFEKHKEAIKALIPRMNWGTIGNKRIDDAQGNQIGRAKHVPMDDALEEIRKQGVLSYNGMQNAVNKALNGEPLSKQEHHTIDLLSQYAENNPDAIANKPITDEQVAKLAEARQQEGGIASFDDLFYGKDTPEDKIAVTELSNDELIEGVGKEVSRESFEAWLNAEGIENEQATDNERIKTQAESNVTSREAKNDTEDTQGNLTERNQQQSALVITQENSEARKHVESIVKRRAAANQLGKSKAFDTHLQLAKDFMHGKEVKPLKFKTAAQIFAKDKPLSDAFNELANLAKAPAKEARIEKTNAIESYKQQIADAKTQDELQAIAKTVQNDKNLTDAQAQALDDIIFEAQDALDTNESSTKEVVNNKKERNNAENNTTTTKIEPAKNNTDLLGDNTAGQQAVANAERAKDEARNKGESNTEGLALTGSNSEADKAAASGARLLFSRGKQRKPFAEQVEDALSGSATGALTIGNTPESLINAGLPDVPLMVTQSVIDKVFYDHALTKKLIQSLPDLLENPVMVFKSDTQPDNFVVMTREIKQESPIVAIIRPNGEIENIKPVNVVATAYGKPVSVIRKWVEKGLLIGADKKKALTFATTNKLRLPAVIQSIRKSVDITVRANKDNVNFSRAPTFYSVLTRAVDEIKINKAPVAQWKAIIKNLAQKGVKPDEIEWTSVNEWLDLQQGQVTKAQVLDYLNVNGVQVEETILNGSANSAYDFRLAKDEDSFDIYKDGEIIENVFDANKALSRIEELRESPAKYSQYTVAGGDNYKELLLTLPANNQVSEAEKVEFEKLGQRFNNEPNFPQKDLERYNEIRSKLANADSAKLYESSHFNQPNILAHVRFDERTDADGKKLLFINEIQSDWGQQGKKKGFGDSEINKLSVVKGNGGIWTVVDSRGNFIVGSATKAGAERKAREYAGQGNAVGVPAAPFVTKTDAWVSLALKRMMRYAAENNFYKVAIINGEQAANLYDLGKQVNAISYMKNKDGTYHVVAEPIGGGNSVELGLKNTEEQLESKVGKDIAKKIVSGEGEFSGGDFTTLKGVDLTVGSEGMRTFYDSIVPKVAKDVLKKVGGSVEPIKLPSKKSKGQLTESVYGMHQAYSDLPPESKAKIDTMYEQGAQLQLGFTITPEMRDKIMGGLPLFSKAATSGGMSKADVEKLIKPQLDKLKNITDVRVVQSQFEISELEQALSRYKADPSQQNKNEVLDYAINPVEGAYHDGTIYIVADSLKSEQRALEVLKHEVTHLSVEQMLETAEKGLYKKLINQITLLDKTGNKYIRKIGKLVDDSQPDLDIEARAKEILAKISELNDEVKDIGEAVRSVWQRFVDGIKAFYKLVFNTDLNDQDVRDIVAMSMRYAQGDDVYLTNIVNGDVVENTIKDGKLVFSRNDRKPSKAQGDTHLTAFMEALSQNKDLFEYQTVDDKNISDIAKAVDVGYEIKPLGASQTKLKKATKAWEVKVPNSEHRSGTIYENSDKVWIDVSRLISGNDRGSAIYAIAADYAHNNGKVLIGDPEGLSRKAVYRRNENMLSNALKHGTTKHLLPHIAQEVPSEYYQGHEAEFGKNVRALAWIEGNDVHNIKELLYNSYDSAIKNIPEVKDVIYNSESGQFEWADGRPFTRQDSERISTRIANDASNPYRAGSSTIKRSALINTFLRKESAGRRAELLDKAISELQRNGLSNNLKGVMYSRSNQSENQNEPPAETTAQVIQRIGQDKFNRFKVLQDWVRSEGLDLSEGADVYQAETLMSGRVASRKEDFRENQVEPLIEKTQKAGITMEQVGEFLKAQHAPEANKRARELQGKQDATAYGVSDANAKAAMDDFKALPNYAELNTIANEWRNITEQTKQIKLDSGLLSDEMVKAWEDTYDVYVPVKGGDENSKIGLGKGLHVNGKNKQRLGHGLRDEAIIENILRDHEAAISLDEKNRVGKSLIKFALEVKNDDIVTIGKPEKRKVLKQGESAYMVNYHGSDTATFDSQKDARAYVAEAVLKGSDKAGFNIIKTSDPVRVMLQASPQLADNEVNVYVKGHAIRLQINDDIAAREYKNMGVEHLNTILSASREVNNWLSKAYTGYSPDFIFTNPLRDAVQGAITLTGNHGAGMSAKIFANYPNAVKELVKHFANKGSSVLVTEYRQQGGSTGGAYLSDLERIGNDIQESYNEYQGALITYKNIYEKAIGEGKKPKTAHTLALLKSGAVGFKKIPIIGHFLRLMEHLNAITENALRVATYQTLRDSGLSKAQAAAQAKNLMNFNRKGEQSNAAGALYLFFNPNVQGSKLIQEALSTSPHKHQAQALAGSMTLLAFTLSMMALNGDDEDKKKWQNTPSYVKDGNLVINMFGIQFTLTLPYGYRVFWALGNIMADATQKSADFAKLGIRLASSAFENFSPIGNPMQGEHGLFQLTPTAPKMLLASGVNEDSFGSPITPKKWTNATPDSQLMNRGTVGSLYDGVTEKLNSLSGGSKYEAGLVDVSPETLKFWVKSLTGGAGQFAFDSINIAHAGMQGVAPQDVKDIPIARRFVRETGVRDSRQAFWERKNEADLAADQLKLARKAHDIDAMIDLRDRKGILVNMARTSDSILKMANARRDMIAQIKSDENLSLSEKVSQIKELEKEEAEIYDEFISNFDSEIKQ